jgi:hypothetical protein
MKMTAMRVLLSVGLVMAAASSCALAQQDGTISDKDISVVDFEDR